MNFHHAQANTLFSPYELSLIKLKNRFVMSPMTRSRAVEGRVPNPLAADYYAQRAGAGLIITEATIVGLLGCVTGLAISLGGARLVASTMHERLGLYISPSLPAREVVLLLLATLTLAAVAGLIPATMAYRTSVARNLRPIA